jgi:hypothetical protein
LDSPGQLELFPTPRASDGPHGGPNQRDSRGGYDALPGMVVNVPPTPTARDWKSGASNLHGKNPRPLNEVALLLKTPTAQLGSNGSAQHPDRRKAGGHGPTLDDELCYLVPDDGTWGDYLPAIERHEALVGRPAPEPTEIGPRGGRRLHAPFAEWLMGLPAGWVTDVEGLNRGQQLKAIGNGVMPHQARAAFEILLNRES